MQTFMPEPCFQLSAQRLDNKRLGKQRVEAKQIYLALTVPGYGWQHHPAVKMWRGYLDALAAYGHAMCAEWMKRGFRDGMEQWFIDHYMLDSGDCPVPEWMFDERVIRSHRGSLIRKDPAWYGRYQWQDATFTGYYWPTSKEIACTES